MGVAYPSASSWLIAGSSTFARSHFVSIPEATPPYILDFRSRRQRSGQQPSVGKSNLSGLIAYLAGNWLNPMVSYKTPENFSVPKTHDSVAIRLANRLYHNLGKGGFADVTDTSGFGKTCEKGTLSCSGSGYSLAAVF
jgi:hypothetical protein